MIGLMAGLFVATLIEGMQWTRHLAKLASPLVRQARLGPVPAAAFALAFFSSASANAMLGEAFHKGELSEREVMLSNLFNSLPSWLAHTPSIFFLTFPVLGFPAAIYTGLTLAAALARTLLTVLLGKLLLPRPAPGQDIQDDLAGGPTSEKPECSPWRQGVLHSLSRFKKRVPRLLFIAIPIYIAIFYLQKAGIFKAAETWLSAHINLLDFLKPEALSIIVLYTAAELGAAIAAAGSVLQSGALTTPDIVLALLIGNVLSTPMRALRHQLPSYAAYYPTGLATKLIAANQGLRALSIIVMAWIYWYITV